MRYLTSFIFTLTIGLFLLAAWPLQSKAQSDFDCRPADPNAASRERQTDMSKMVVEVSFSPELALVKGKVTHHFRVIRERVDSLVLDAPGIEVSEVRLNNNSIRHRSTEEHLICYFSTPLKPDADHQLLIQYESNPRKGIYFIGWNSKPITDPKHQSRKQIWTQGQGIDNRHWIPMYDDMNDKFITETIVTFDSAYSVLSNGVLKQTKANADGSKTWHYAMSKPHAGYLLMLAIGEYAVKNSETKNGLPVSFWYYPQHPEKLKWTSLYTEEIIEFLEEETGVPYPWESYAQVMVQDFMYGAMENTTATIFGDFFWVDSIAFNDRYYVGVNAHELTHQWFGDLITARSAADIWLQESWATYYAKLFEASVYGEDHLKWSQRQEVESALRASKKDHYPVRHSKGGTSRVYAKGSTVIQMLRYVLGDEAFKRVVRSYLQQYAYENVASNDFFQVIQDELGLTLDWFFEQWLYRAGEPHYELKYDVLAEELVAQVKQIHTTDHSIGYFKMPIKCRLHYQEGGFSEKTFWVDGPFTEIRMSIEDGKTPAFFLFDVNSEISKQISMQQSTEAWLAQFKNAQHMIDRYDALLQLRELPLEVKERSLKNCFSQENFWAVRSEILQQLTAAGEDQWVAKQLEKETDIQVLRSFFLSHHKTEGVWKALWEKMLNAESYQLRVKAMEMLCEAYPSSAENYLRQMKDQRGHLHDVRISFLEQSLNVKADQPALRAELKELASDRYEFRTRTTAFGALKRLGIFDEESLSYALDAAISSNRRLAGPAVSYVNYFISQNRYKKQYFSYLETKFKDEQKRKWLQQSGLPLK